MISYLNYVTKRMAANGMVPFYRDEGSIGNHGFGIMNRSNNTVFDQAVFDQAVFDQAVFDQAVFDQAVFDQVALDAITLGIKGLGPLTEEGAGLLIMAIAGGALVVVQGMLADKFGRSPPSRE